MSEPMREDMKESIDLYVQRGIPPGDFLQAVLANDLMDAFRRADSQDREAWYDICSYIYSHTPRGCHGSREVVAAYIAAKSEELAKP